MNRIESVFYDVPLKLFVSNVTTICIGSLNIGSIPNENIILPFLSHGTIGMVAKAHILFMFWSRTHLFNRSILASTSEAGWTQTSVSTFNVGIDFKISKMLEQDKNFFNMIAPREYTSLIIPNFSFDVAAKKERLCEKKIDVCTIFSCKWFSDELILTPISANNWQEIPFFHFLIGNGAGM